MPRPMGHMPDMTVAIGYLKAGIEDAIAEDALARVSSQDVGQIHALFTRSEISPPVCSAMISQLGNACGALGPAFASLTQKGVELMQKYSGLGFGQQILWIRADLRIRETMYAQDDRVVRATNAFNNVNNDAAFQAIVHRMQINYSQIQYLKLVESELTVLLQPQLPASAAQVPARPALRAVSVANAASEQIESFNRHVNELRSISLMDSRRTDVPTQTPASQVPKTTQLPAAMPARLHSSPRAPLQSVPANEAIRNEPQHPKRKRVSPKRIVNPEIVPSDGDASEDEQELQGQLEALQSKIAAIRARTAHEDDIVPLKKVKMNLKNAPHVTAKPNINTPTRDMKGPPPTFAVSLAEDPFKPPRSSQDVRNLPPRATLPIMKSENGSHAIRKLAPTPTLSTAAPMSTCGVVDLTSSPPIQQVQMPASVPTSVEPVLCAEQQKVVDLILAGKNVFYTGSAGCGKSTVLKSFVPKLRDLGKCVRIVAPTGKAALDINGSTTWTYAGWTPSHMKQPLSDLIKAAHGRFVRRRFNDTDVLVIDEISMVENHLLRRLDAVMKEARGSTKAFGGVQLVVTGDFCQLPPVKPFQFCIHCGKEQTQRVVAGKVVYRCPQHGDSRDEDKWAFRSPVWKECNFQHINLSKIHRQKDEVFIKILQKLRLGTFLSHEDRTLLLNHPCDVTNAVKLFPRRAEVKRINDTEFDRLTTPKHGFTCLDFFAWNEVHRNLQSKGIRNSFDDSLEALREHRLENRVEYKIGMLVVLLVNLDITAGLVNGSQGRIVGFEPYDPSKLPKATVFEGSKTVSSQRKPGRSSSGRFASSQRRGRDSSMEPEPIVMGELRGEHALLREGQIRHFLERPCNPSKHWPIVEFDNGITRTIFADCQVNELGDEKPYTLLARTQIPLTAAWAMTIHKSQGMTINKVIVDLGGSFEEGQEYVALSRARRLDGLKVVSLGAGVGKGGNEQVRQFIWDKFKIG